MRRKTVERWISMALDGELSPRRRCRLDRVLAARPELQALQRAWGETGAKMRALAPPRGRTPEAMWHDVQRAVRAKQPREGTAPDGLWIFGSPLRWAGATLGVLATCAALLALVRHALVRQAPDVAVTEPAQVEWVETDLPGATPMVYQDAETGWTIIWVLADEEGRGEAGS